jgi:hypothetical protein
VTLRAPVRLPVRRARRQRVEVAILELELVLLVVGIEQIGFEAPRPLVRVGGGSGKGHDGRTKTLGRSG